MHINSVGQSSVISLKSVWGGIPRTLPGWWLCWLWEGKRESSAVSQPGENVVGESGNEGAKAPVKEQRSQNRLCALWLASLTMVKALRVRRVVYTVCHTGRGVVHQ